jgi:hypothetical protein
MKARDRFRRRSSGRSDDSPAKAQQKPWSLLEWGIAVCMILMVLAMVFGSKLTTPVHANFSSELLKPLTTWAFACLVLTFFVGLLSVAIGYVYKSVGQLAMQTAGILMGSGISLFCVQAIANGLNVHFDSSAAVKVTTPILGIVPAPPGSRSGSSLRLADWRNSHDVVLVRQDVRVFRMDMDNKYASFYVRQGFFGMPYATQYR